MTRLLAAVFTAVLVSAGSAAAAGRAAVAPVADPGPPPPPPPPVPLAAPGADCFPACRTGFFCHLGQCVSACNPPCGAGEQCSPTGQCVPGYAAPVDRDVPRATEGSERAPAGYHYEQHRKVGLLIGGVIPFGIGYAVAVGYGIYCSTTYSSYLYNGGYNVLYAIPLVGPLLRQAAVTSVGSYYNSYQAPTDWVLAAMMMAAEGVGFTLAMLGLRTTQELVAGPEVASAAKSSVWWTLAPGAPGGALGLTLLVKN